MSDTHTREALLALFPQYEALIKDAQPDETINERASGRYNKDDMQGRTDVTGDHQDTVRKYVHWY